MAALELTALEGASPLGFLAALGCLGAVERTRPSDEPALSWADAIVPVATLHSGIENIDELVEVLVEDLAAWTLSAVLDYDLHGNALDEVKLAPGELRAWVGDVQRTAARGTTAKRDIDLLCALVAETALDNNGNAKPTDLHFAAGQQRFLKMARELRGSVGASDFEEALVGPWRHDSELPTFDWDPSSERVYALRAGDPSKDKKSGVPGADWLGFCGLAFLPVVARSGRATTTGCGGTWKRGTFTWPLWNVPLAADTARSAIGLAGLANMTPATLRARGLTRVLRSPIRRTDQGGYGSIGIPEVLVAST